MRREAELLNGFVLIVSMAVIALAWVGAYYLRKYLPLPFLTKQLPPIDVYIKILPYGLIAWVLVFKVKKVGFPHRTTSAYKEAKRLVEAFSLAVALFLLIVYFVQEYKPSRAVFGYFWLLGSCGLAGMQIFLRWGLRTFRARGANRKNVLIVGVNGKTRRLVKVLRANAEFGYVLRGVLTASGSYEGDLAGAEVVGKYDDMEDVLKRENIDVVFLTLPLEEHALLPEIIEKVKDEMIDVKFLPDFSRLVPLKAEAEEIGGLTIVNILESPIRGWGMVVKRVFDIVVSIVGIIVSAPSMVIIAIAIKLTSPGPVLYKQLRMSLDGREFWMLKFRSMRVDAESKTGPVWAVENDPRCTKVGKFLRRTSLDELPQLFNVLKGDMSIVGPRPERPEFIDEFRKHVPWYMVRHKVKAGITGWAQINGWRGNTSLEKRIEHDLYYIKNWSIWLDIRILLRTFLTFMKNAY